MLTFEMLEIAFFGLLFFGLVFLMVGFCAIFIGLYSRNLAVKPKMMFKIGGIIMAISLIPLIMTMFV